MRIILILAALLLSACSTSTPPAEKPNADPVKLLRAAGGTSAYSDRAGVAIMLEFNLDAPEEDVRVSVLGPGGWNKGQASRRLYSSIDAGRFATWFNIARDNNGELMDVVDGTYLVQTVINGVTVREEVLVDADTRLSTPSSIQVQGDKSAVAVCSVLDCKASELSIKIGYEELNRVSRLHH